MKLPNLGIDIAKAKFNVCLLQLNGKLKHKVFPNELVAFYQAVFCKSLAKQSRPQVQVALEI